MAATQRKVFELSPYMIDQMKVMSGLGMPSDQMAAIFSISKDTLERAIKRQPDARAALEKGRAMASTNVRQTAYKMATSGNNPSMTMFWLKTREGFRETDRLEVTGADGSALVKSDISRDEIEKELAKLRSLREKLSGTT